MWVENDHTVGCVRVESDGTLHFSVDRNYGTDVPGMLREARGLSAEHGGRLKAVVDKADGWRTKALLEAGFREYPVRFLAYKP